MALQHHRAHLVLVAAASTCCAVLLWRRLRVRARTKSRNGNGQCATVAEPDGITIRGWPSGVVNSGVSRTVICAEALSWLRDREGLPSSWCVITSLPDLCEVQMRHAEYEAWFVEAVRLLFSRLSPHQVAIFYQTDGRHSSNGGSWLDKSLLCHLGARAAGAACVWHRIVCTASPGEPRTGRPGYAHLMCFSVAHRATNGRASVDVLGGRGHMSWARAMGSDACNAAVEYVLAAGLGDEEGGEPPVVFDPFCGCGSVLAAANAYGVEAVGVELCRKRCRASALYTGPEGTGCGRRLGARRTGRAARRFKQQQQLQARSAS